MERGFSEGKHFPGRGPSDLRKVPFARLDRPQRGFLMFVGSASYASNTTAPLGNLEAIRTATNRVFDAENPDPDASITYVAL